jgi:hypothetical protein
MRIRLRTSLVLIGAVLAAALSPRAARAGGDDAAPARSPHLEVGTLDLPGRPAAAAKAGALAALPSSLPIVPRPVDLGPGLAPAQDRGPASRHALAIPIGETLATNLAMMEWNRYVGEAPWAEVTSASVGRNLRSGWVLDDDQFWVNQFGHPYQGTWSFTAARSAGLGFWGSAPFTFGASALWELAGETTSPSVNDQVTTTVAGIAFGEILYRFAGALRAEGGTWREVVASVLAPWGAVNHRLVGTSQAIPEPPSRWQAFLGGASLAGAGPAGARATVPYGGLSFTYGVPGSAALELDRPFDHFVLDVDWTAAGDPAATVCARGLLAGATFDAGAARGLWGGFLSFDFVTPPGYRVSTSAVGFGGSARADVGAGLALEGDAIASAVLLGAGGSVAPAAEGTPRDYRFGPGQQGLVALRVLAGDRAAAGVEVRQYLLFSADAVGGTELLVHGTASATLRLAGSAGLGVEVTRYLRRADLADATARSADTAVRVYVVSASGWR